MTEEQEILLGKALAEELTREEAFGHSAMLEDYPEEGDAHLRDRRVGAVLGLLLEGESGRAPFEHSLEALARSKTNRSTFMNTTRRRAQAARRKRLVGMAAGAVLVVLGALALRGRGPGDPRLRVEWVGGEVRILERPGVQRGLRLGERLEPAASVETGPTGSLALSYRDGTRISVGGSSALSSRPQGGGLRLDLARGILQADLPASGDPLVFATPQATAEGRGARLWLAAGPKVSGLEVTQGSVRLSAPRDRSIEVAAGRYAIVAPNAPLFSWPGTLSSPSVAYGVVAGEPFLLLRPGEPAREPLRNGSMTEGESVPLGWENREVKTGALAVSRDTQVFQTGPASLRVETVGGPAVGEVAQAFEGTPGAKLVLEGYARSAGHLKATVMVRAFDDIWKELDARPLQAIQNDADWTPWKRRFELPDRTSWVLVAFQIEGEGRAWLDEVKAAWEK